MRIFETLITLIEINATKLIAILNKKQTTHHTFRQKNVNQFTIKLFYNLNKFTIVQIRYCLLLIFIKLVSLHKYTFTQIMLFFRLPIKIEIATTPK